MFLDTDSLNNTRKSSLLHEASSPRSSGSSSRSSSSPSSISPEDIVRRVFGPGVNVSPTLYSGSYSSTFVVSGSIPIVKIRQQLRNSVNAFHSFHRPSKVLVKITDAYMGQHEAAVMRRVRSTKSEQIACRRGAGSLLIPKQVVPAVYAAGELFGKYVIVMEFIEGKPLSVLPHITPEIAALFEQAVLSTWLAGVIHADLHENNIMVVGGYKPRVVLLDFGMSVIVDGERAQKLRRSICDPDKVFDDADIKNFIAVHQGMMFGRIFVNPNDNALRDVSLKSSPSFSLKSSPSFSLKSSPSFTTNIARGIR